MVGYGRGYYFSGRAFLYSNNQFIDLHDSVNWENSFGYDINATGQVLLETYGYDGSKHTLLYQNGIFKDITPPNYGFSSSEINDLGHIAGSGSYLSTGPYPALAKPPVLSIDIKPGDDGNSINLRSKNISVAILSSDDFNAPQQVDQATLTFGPTGNEVRSTGCTRKSKDVNGDRHPDLVCQFPMKFEGSLPLFECGDTVGLLKGEMVLPDGRSSFEGQQEVVISPCK